MSVYEDKPRFDLWLELVLIGVLAATFVAGVTLLFMDIAGALVMLGVTVFDALLFKAILPRRFQIYQDRVKIVLGGPFAITVPFHNIKDVRRTPGHNSLAYNGMRFATSMKFVVEIRRYKGMNVLISPYTGEVFLEQLRQAIAGASKP